MVAEQPTSLYSGQIFTEIDYISRNPFEKAAIGFAMFLVLSGALGAERSGVQKLHIYIL